MNSALGTALVALSFLAPLAAHAQEMGDPKAGAAYARQVCSECHAVGRIERVSPHPRAPSFASVANAPGMTGTALRVWFQSPHPSMPNLVISEKQGDDLVAYIMSLKRN